MILWDPFFVTLFTIVSMKLEYIYGCLIYISYNQLVANNYDIVLLKDLTTIDVSYNVETHFKNILLPLRTTFVTHQNCNHNKKEPYN